MMLKRIENCPKPPPKRVPWARYQKVFKFTLHRHKFSEKSNKKNYNIAKELYSDTTIFVFQFFIGYLPKKHGKLKMAQGC